MTSGGMGLNESLGHDISQEELDFSDLFLYNSPGDDFPNTYDKDGSGVLLQNQNQLAAAQDLSSHGPTAEHLSGAVFESLGLSSRPSLVIPAPSPRIEITLLVDSHGSQPPDLRLDPKALGDYRDCVSPASSNSSTGWPAEGYSPVASPCVSPPNRACGTGLSSLDLCPGLQGIHTSSAHSSPGASPHNSITDETFLAPQQRGGASPNLHQRSRSASPHKRSYDQAYSCQGGTPIKQRSRSPSPIPSPYEQQPSFYPTKYHPQAEFQPVVQSSTLGLEEILNSLSSRAGASVTLQDAHLQAQRLDCVCGEGYDWVIEQKTTGSVATEVTSEAFCMLPAVWPPRAVHHAAFSPTLPPMPPLERPLPTQSGHFELLIQQQPRSHHRAHYETEGSRGAVKTSNGGHPEVQLCGYHGTAPLGLQVYIGTADERLLKPHAFYQVHRITGKTVTTPSMETMMNGTKVLEIPLEPKNHMRVVIDCVGILKLRNADIELRNGETDIGRKNTRVRLVFRVHVPQPGGQLLSLQVASEPIECSQRSAQEIPAVERQDLDCCSALGGQQMVLTGQNFTSDSKVIFSEKTQEGKQVWEVEAAVDRDKTQASMLFVEIPPYRSHAISKPAKVNFYVVNGKKKRSQPQHFIYTPVIAIKSEPVDDYQLDSYSRKSLCHHLEQESNLQSLNISPSMYHLTTVDPRAHVLTTDLLDEPSVYHQSRVSPLINRPMLYHAANPHYSSCSTAVLNSSLLASNPASIVSQCHSASASAAKLVEGPHTGDLMEAGLMSRHQGFGQTALPLGKSSPSGYVHEPTQGKAGTWVELGDQHLVQIGSARRHLEEQALEKVIVKQENYYLEDVNDIIKRDLKGHNGEQS